ncbi:3-hydroxyacyl-CoA dehydrogenase family protein [Aeromicrobium sp. IC_218]|uniref:3-hydroxyacyl-CoA dehydrogenase family protein n=1 Tax=Aeromicrobium sp. IC_218 TaxID=2545468 RepID=UPI0010389697|nr:3-hydroxyacyl-CoA dehydrogenase family protein [Aeromicrobium sp. IC_218]TCI96382.1 3-hydroxyacyl-CoA dehydrogenase family protein [Aeromicrobium sp. IC_218]
MSSTTNVPDVVGVYGGGRMGAGIAHAFLLAGSQVRVVEATPDSVVAARDRVASSIAKAAERATDFLDAEAVLARLHVTTEAAELGEAGLVVEAVPEDVALKRTVLGIVDQAAPDADLATNTSSLSVDELASALGTPERLVGLHFFNPVPASTLVEVVVGPRTAPDLGERAAGWVAGLGKTAITVTDSPGFASSRLGVAIALEAMRMLEEGVASAEDIDTAMTLGYKHPTGPLRTTDIVGLDVRLAIAEHLAREVGQRFEPPAVLRDKVAAGQLGRKSGQGFYRW